MKKLFFYALLLTVTGSYAQVVKKIAEIKDQSPEILVVVNGVIAGQMKDVKYDLYNVPTDMIDSLNVLKGESAIKKYGDKGKPGVIELYLKNAALFGAKGIVEPASSSYPADSVFTEVDIQASFPGGDAAWRRYLERNFNGNVPVDNFSPPGTFTVIIQFIVDKTGAITEVKPLTKFGFGMEEEAVRVISKGPKWQPAIMNGIMVRSYRKQPVTFQTMSEFELSTYTLKAGEKTTIEVIGISLEAESFSVAISSGSLTALGNKKYAVLVDKPGYVYFTVWQTIKKKKAELGKIALKVE
ncbi:MAG TPA: energy transducer TonB [Chitinophagaceae bacterium]|jgi:hypothetical protein|nr:energy transducer TonB [Chitinophagaceae bacterium]